MTDPRALDAYNRRMGLQRIMQSRLDAAPRTSALAMLNAHAPVPPQSLPAFEVQDDE